MPTKKTPTEKKIAALEKRVKVLEAKLTKPYKSTPSPYDLTSLQPIIHGPGGDWYYGPRRK